MSLRNLVLGVALAAMFVAGCSSKEPGNPSAATTTRNTGSPGPTTSTTGSGGGAPKVSDPLDATRFFSQPCALVPASLLQSFDLPAEGTPDTTSQIGAGCSWFNRDIGSGLDVSFLSANKNGLSDIYRGRERFKGYFEPTEVDGYPAVYNDIGDDRGKGGCNITVGISDTLTFRSSVRYTKLGSGACDRVKQVASAVIQTVKKGA